jgi:hypothetical protein
MFLECFYDSTLTTWFQLMFAPQLQQVCVCDKLVHVVHSSIIIKDPLQLIRSKPNSNGARKWTPKPKIDTR